MSLLARAGVGAVVVAGALHAQAVASAAHLTAPAGIDRFPSSGDASLPAGSRAAHCIRYGARFGQARRAASGAARRFVAAVGSSLGIESGVSFRLAPVGHRPCIFGFVEPIEVRHAAKQAKRDQRGTCARVRDDSSSGSVFHSQTLGRRRTPISGTFRVADRAIGRSRSELRPVVVKWSVRKVTKLALSRAQRSHDTVVQPGSSNRADFCVEALQEALWRLGQPEIFNTDQGQVHGGRLHQGAARATGGRYVAPIALQ
jgi:hypothetical protein